MIPSPLQGALHGKRKTNRHKEAVPTYRNGGDKGEVKRQEPLHYFLVARHTLNHVGAKDFPNLGHATKWMFLPSSHRETVHGPVQSLECPSRIANLSSAARKIAANTPSNAQTAVQGLPNGKAARQG